MKKNVFYLCLACVIIFMASCSKEEIAPLNDQNQSIKKESSIPLNYPYVAAYARFNLNLSTGQLSNMNYLTTTHIQSLVTDYTTSYFTRSNQLNYMFTTTTNAQGVTTMTNSQIIKVVGGGTMHPNEFEWDKTTSTLYALRSNQLYKCTNLATGTFQLITNNLPNFTDMPATYNSSITIAADGQMYFLTCSSGTGTRYLKIYKVNKNDGTYTLHFTANIPSNGYWVGVNEMAALFNGTYFYVNMQQNWQDNYGNAINSRKLFKVYGTSLVEVATNTQTYNIVDMGIIYGSEIMD